MEKIIEHTRDMKVKRRILGEGREVYKCVGGRNMGRKSGKEDRSKQSMYENVNETCYFLS